jgi:hypothetical protein
MDLRSWHPTAEFEDGMGDVVVVSLDDVIIRKQQCECTKIIVFFFDED